MTHSGTAFLLGSVSASFLAFGMPGAETDAKTVVQKCMQQVTRNERLRTAYTYRARDVDQELDASDKVKSSHVSVDEILYIGGKRYERPIEKDGKPLPPAEAKKEQEKLDRTVAEASRLTPQERDERWAKLSREREKQGEWMREIPQAYQLQFEAPSVIDGHRMYVIRADPRNDYNGKYSSLLRSTRGKFFIDQQDYTLVRLQAEVLDTISFGLFLAKVSKGTSIDVTMTRVGDEIWLPKEVDVHAAARILFKSKRMNEHITFSDYRKYQSESKITFGEVQAQ